MSCCPMCRKASKKSTGRCIRLEQVDMTGIEVKLFHEHMKGARVHVPNVNIENFSKLHGKASAIKVARMVIETLLKALLTSIASMPDMASIGSAACDKIEESVETSVGGMYAIGGYLASLVTPW